MDSIDFEHIDFKDLIDNDNLICNSLKEEKKLFNYEPFIFNNIPNLTSYDIENSNNDFQNLSVTNINILYENVYKKNEKLFRNDDYSYYLKNPLKSIKFKEQINVSNKDKLIFKQDTTLEKAIEIIGYPLEYNFNTNKNDFRIIPDDEDFNHFKENSEFFDTINEQNKSQGGNPEAGIDLKEYSLYINNSMQINPLKIKAFANSLSTSIIPTKLTFDKKQKKFIPMRSEVLNLILNTTNDYTLKM